LPAVAAAQQVTVDPAQAGAEASAMDYLVVVAEGAEHMDRGLQIKVTVDSHLVVVVAA
jgi:hypothetical protein